jgi:glycosyltransferase involved in cell wall biosynthesis
LGQAGHVLDRGPTGGASGDVSILHCVTGLNIGGAETMLVSMLEATARFRWSVLSLLTPGLLGPKVIGAGADLQTLDMTPTSVSFTRIPELRRAVRRARPDLVHGWMHHGMIAATVGASGLGVPVVWGVHHSIGALEREKPRTRKVLWLAARLSSGAAAITYTSRTAAEQYEALGFDPRRTVVIPNGVNCAVFKPSETARPDLSGLLGIPPERIVIGHVARYAEMKDPETLIAAIGTLFRDGTDLHLVVIGPGHENGEILRLAEEAGLGGRVSVFGATTEIAAMMPGFDVHVITSRWGETFSLATAEAMACGVPAVVTDLGDCGWVVGDAGICVPPGEPAAVTAALRRLISLSPAERRQLGVRARDRIVRLFSRERYIASQCELYDAISTTKPPAPGWSGRPGVGEVLRP